MHILHHFLLLAPLLGEFVQAISYPLPINGWYSCREDTFANPLTRPKKAGSLEEQKLKSLFSRGNSILDTLAQPLANSDNGTFDDFSLLFSRLPTQCAQFVLPMCHNRICDGTSNIDVFVKRIAAKSSDKPKAVWLLQGGPGASSVAMEKIMVSIYRALKGNVDVYTMDHRGTGRSHRLGCTATQVETSGSPTYGELTAEVLSDCIQDVNFQLGGSANSSMLSAFSTTSAALDISALINNSNNSNTYVYGVSYGTYLVERLMQLNNPNIKGYILDGVVSQSGSKDNKKLVFNDWDSNMNEVAEQFMSLCAQSGQCNEKFKSLDLKSSLQKLLGSFSGTSNNWNDCQVAVKSYGWAIKSENPSETLKQLLASLLKEQQIRGFIPILVYRFLRCNKDDSIVIYNFLTQYRAIVNLPDESQSFQSNMLYLLIVTSELWRFPTESAATLSGIHDKALLSNNVSSMVPLVCIASGGKDPNCQSYKPSNGYLLQYQRDEYFEKPITIPDQASVIMLSGLLDPQTPAKYARYQYDSFNGTAKKLFEFAYAAHGTVVNSLDGGSCAVSIISSYIQANGNLYAIDPTCISASEFITRAFSIDRALVHLLTGIKITDSNQPYEGAPAGYFKESDGLSTLEYFSDDDKNSKYLVPMIIGFVLAGILLIVAIFIYIKKSKNNTPTQAPVLTPVNEP